MNPFKFRGGLVGALVGMMLTALFYLGDQIFRLPFFPYDLFDWLARVLPGDMVTLGIDTMVDAIRALNISGGTSSTAKQMELLTALLLFVVIWLLLGWLVAGIGRRSHYAYQLVGTAVAVVVALVAIAIELDLSGSVSPLGFVWLAALLLLGGWFTGWVLDDMAAAATAVPLRRHFLMLLGATGAAWAAGYLLKAPPAQTGANQEVMPADMPTNLADVATDPAELEGRLTPAPGTRPEITPNEDFYRIDINTRPPAVMQDAWELEVAGLFDNPRNLTMADLMAYPAVTQPLTLSCISNRIGGDLISASEWTGVRLGLVLDDLGLQPEAQELYIEAVDGFYESVAHDDMMDPRTLLVYAMNGQTLPQAHGFPLRIYIPNRYGMKQPKWITRIEAIADQGPGYWVERNWSAEARPHVISIIDTVATEARDENGRIPLGGIAWAGDRGIQQVEVQVDDGPWQAAALRLPPRSSLTWVQWRYDWPAQSGDHTFRVRATDGAGMLQIGEESDVRPDGATGYHSVSRSIA